MVDGVRSVPKSDPSSQPAVDCFNCGSPIDTFPNIDHDPKVCPTCQAGVFMYSTLERNILVDIERAPIELKEFFKWARSMFDEMEFMRLIMAFEEMLCPQSSQDAERDGHQD